MNLERRLRSFSFHKVKQNKNMAHFKRYDGIVLTVNLESKVFDMGYYANRNIHRPVKPKSVYNVDDEDDFNSVLQETLRIKLVMEGDS
jgi:hypothetical protein